MLSNAVAHDYMQYYHHRGELPRLLANGKVTKLARLYTDPSMPEELCALKLKYQDIYVNNEAVASGSGKGGQFCVLCFKNIKDQGVSFSNFMKHARACHRSELTAMDQ